MPAASRRPLVLAAALALAATGCSTRPPPPPGPQLVAKSPPVDARPSLAAFESCDALEARIEDAQVAQMKATLELYRGWRSYPMPVGAVGADGPAAPVASPAPESFTTTNQQVDGVAEADFVQNDGTRILALAGGKLHLARSWPPGSMAKLASVPIEGWPHDLFLSGDRAVVFSAVHVPRAGDPATQPCPIFDAGGGDVAAGILPCGWSDPVVKVTTLDVSALAAPVVTSEIYLPGSYVSARRIGDRARVVLSEGLEPPPGLRYWPEAWRPEWTQEEFDAAMKALAAANEALIRARTLDDWLRKVTVRRPGQPDVEVGHACGDFSAGDGPVRPGVLTVATLDVPSASLVSRTSVLGDAGVVHASASTLYVGAYHWWWWPEPGQRDATYLHAFDLTDPDRAVYAGSGVVDGWIRDQYGMDEHAGALRVATTVGWREEDGTPWGRFRTAGRLSVLAREGGALVLAGETPPFGLDERIFGTRFMGARGFVITAAQIDPLFTFDLSDPASPRIMGELEMPGFISYLHPISDTHLLGVGMERAQGADGNRVKVALFDVSDLARPVDVATVLVGEGWAWSEALWDPKAFTWFGARKLLAIPFADWTWPEPGLVSDLRVFEVDPATGITPRGSLSMADLYLTWAGEGWSWRWSPYVRRSIMADDFVYAVSDAGVRAARVADLPAWVSTIEFEPYRGP
jgi:hypothetical protein